MRHWKTVHKQMCKNIAKFQASVAFQASRLDRRTDAYLLSHLVAEHESTLSKSEELLPEDVSNPLGTFSSLLPQPSDSDQDEPLICPMEYNNRISPNVLKALFRRFSNNNFSIHSVLTPVGHGIFPLASRLFNHSCVPNAVATYTFFPEGVQASIKALAEIKTGDEVSSTPFTRLKLL